jgi:heterodisulfide reductase subunit D
MGIYEIPREIYNKIPGLKLVEMKRNRNFAWCCGAGGGVKIGYPEWAVEVSKERLEEAKKTGASVISSTCPFCRTNLGDANANYSFDMEVLDLVEIIDKLNLKVIDNKGGL